MKFKNKTTGEMVEWNYIGINSALLSAQSRKRLYWTNIPNVEQPEDKNIYLIDIIESGRTDSMKSYCIDANYFKGGNLKQYFEKSRRQLVFQDKSPTIVSTIYKENPKSVLHRKKLGLLIGEQVPTTFSRHEKLSGKILDKSLPLESSNWRGLNRNQRQTAIANMIESGDVVIRKLTPIECERLQTVDDNHTQFGDFGGKIKKISNTQRYKMLGNGFTVSVISHILSLMI
jgi:site-specific DNA-cytosine methylase